MSNYPENYDAEHQSNGTLAPVFHTLLQSPYGFHWARFYIQWDSAGTANASGTCVPYRPNGVPSQQLGWLAAAMFYAEDEDGLTPVFALTSGAIEGGNDGTNPTDAQYTCALQELLNALQNPGQWGMELPDVLPAHAYIEPYNEPSPTMGSACEPGAGEPSYFCAVAYYNDAVGVDSSLGRADTLIAGTFSAATTQETSAPSTCSNSDVGFDYCYVEAMTFYYGLHPTDWSFHDYHDVQNSWGCNAIGGAYCMKTEAQNFHNLLASFGLATNNVWITESGTELNGATCGGCLDGNITAQADAAEGWLNLEWTGLVSHLFWFEQQTYGNGQSSSGSDDFDSSLIGIDQPDYSGKLGGAGSLDYDAANPSWSGGSPTSHGNAVPRASYCVIAFNDSPSAATSDNRCDYAGTSPQQPWTDWQGDG